MTIGHHTFPVPSPFLVLATQNPIESEGTYALPEAQIDRFMLKILVDYPAHDEELTVVARSLEEPPELAQVLSLEELTGCRAGDGGLRRSGADQLDGRRRHGDAPPDRARARRRSPTTSSFGASPRGPISLVAAARALALIRGRDYVVPGDVDALVRDAFRHRLVLSYRALAEEVASDTILDQVLAAMPTPADRPRPRASRLSCRNDPLAPLRTPEQPGPGPALGVVAARARAVRRPARRRPARRRLPLGLRGRRQRAVAGAPSTSRVTTCAGSNGTSRRARVSRTCASSSPSASSSRGSCSTRPPRCRSEPATGARPMWRRVSRSPSGTQRPGAATVSGRSRSASSRRSSAPRQGRRALLDTLQLLRNLPAGGTGGLRDALELADRVVRQRALVVARLGLPWAARLARAAAAARRAAHRARRRGPRPARAGACRRR